MGMVLDCPCLAWEAQLIQKTVNKPTTKFGTYTWVCPINCVGLHWYPLLWRAKSRRPIAGRLEPEGHGAPGHNGSTGLHGPQICIFLLELELIGPPSAHRRAPTYLGLSWVIIIHVDIELRPVFSNRKHPYI